MRLKDFSLTSRVEKEFLTAQCIYYQNMICDNSCTKTNHTIFYILDLLLYQRAPKVCKGGKNVYFVEFVVKLEF